MQETLKKNGWDSVKLSPETTGKKSQFGDIDELLRLRKETGCSICVDFAHLLAREGSIDYPSVFKKLDKYDIKDLHCHFSGIEYTEKGERRHIPTEKEYFTPLFDEALKHDINLHIVNESPMPLDDTIKGKKLYEELINK
jgi:deoxyribonuclease-4